MQGNKIKEYEMGVACSMKATWDMRNAYEIMAVKLEGWELLAYVERSIILKLSKYNNNAFLKKI
jgi:hypothetical protein